MPCNMCIVKVEICGTNALTTLLPLAQLGSSRAIISAQAGFIVTMTLLYVSMGATASVKLLNDCSTFEQTPRHYTKTGFSIGSLHRDPCVQCAFFRVLVSRFSLVLSSFVLLSLDHYSLNKRWTVSLHPRLLHRISTITPSTICGILHCNCSSSST